MLPRQPLRFLLADDPGAGKTIMAGLLIKELIARADLQRCMVVCPGSLAEQWQDKLYRRFQLSFEILTNDKLEAARTGNWFLENNLVIARLDKLSRNEDVQQKLQAPECRWDLVVCDEAHKLSATFFGGEIKYTKRYHLGQLLSGLTRHLLLTTATSHNGKEEDFQLFMALLDGDRFEGRFRDGVHQVELSDLMRRMVKEKLLKFDGTLLFPERIAHTVPYKLSNAEAQLYKEVTDYVRDEFNRAEKLENNKRTGTVGFALTILQRRLASSPEAIYQSLHRRSERLQKRLRELELLQRGNHVAIRQLVDDFGRYLYFPRLQNTAVLLNAIRAGLALLTWEQDASAYAESCDEAGARYRGLTRGAQLRVTADDSGLLVRPEVARQQIDHETSRPVRTNGETGQATASGPTGTRPITQPTGPVQPPKPRRYHGTVALDSARVGRDASRIADEVITHLVGLIGSTVQVTLEIEAQIPDGAADNVVRTVTENGRTLKFSANSGFEAE